MVKWRNERPSLQCRPGRQQSLLDRRRPVAAVGILESSERTEGTMKSGSLSLARARELAQLVKAASKGGNRSARKKTGRASSRVLVSQSFYERYLGHFGVGSAETRTAQFSRSRTSKRPARRRKAVRK